MSTTLPPVGTKVTLAESIDRYPHFLAEAGLTGVISEADEDGIWVKMDEHLEGADDWDNQIQWGGDLYDPDTDWVAEFYKEVAVHAPVVADNYRIEFPNFGELDVEIPEGFVDSSWKNDSCPCFINHQKDICIWIEPKNPADRKVEDTPRFSITRLEGGYHPVGGDNHLIYGDDWNEIVAFINSYKGWVPPMNDLVARVSAETIEVLDARATAAKQKRLAERARAFLDDLDRQEDLSDKEPSAADIANRHVAEELIQHCDEYIDMVDAKIERLKNDTMSMYLPIGAVIRVKKDVGNKHNFFERHGKLPVSDSLGVVTGLTSRESTLMVTFPDGVEISGRERIETQEGKPVTMSLDADMLEVVNYAHFHDNRQCRTFEFIPTHKNAAGEAVMVISIGLNHLRLQETEDGNLECVEVIDRDQTFPGVVSRLPVGGKVDMSSGLKM